MKRVTLACPALHFRQPTDDGVPSKTASLQMLLADGANIVMSHELLSRQEVTPRMVRHIQEYGYTLILDEVLEVIQPVSNITKGEARMLMTQGWITVDEGTGMVRWLRGDEKTSRFKDIRARARSHSLIWYNDTLFLWLFPIGLLQAFANMHVLTFAFAGSHLKHYLDLHGMAYSYSHVQDAVLMQGHATLAAQKEQIAALLDLYEGPLNDIGMEETALSKNWSIKQRRTGKVKVLFNNARNMLMNRYRASSDDALWTCFKEDCKRYGLKGYAGAFCPCNARATNEYRLRDNLAYLVNVYDHPYIVRWFAGQGIQLDQDAFALSQLMQWLWRSAIRDGKPVRVYIPSRRMRELLLAWLGKPVT